MTATTAYERKQRRREVVRLRAKGFTQAEIAEELAVSESTIRRDIERINSELSKLDDPDILKRELKQGVKILMEEEYEDIKKAEREADEKAKHRAKSSFRQTLELVKKVEDDFGTDGEDQSDDWLEDVDPELKNQIIEAAGARAEQRLAE